VTADAAVTADTDEGADLDVHVKTKTLNSRDYSIQYDIGIVH
jgi:hypothetical protein